MYSTPPADLSGGTDVVVCVARQKRHEPSHLGEELPRMPGFDLAGTHMAPRNFLNSSPEPREGRLEKVCLHRRERSEGIALFPARPYGAQQGRGQLSEPGADERRAERLGPRG